MASAKSDAIVVATNVRLSRGVSRLTISAADVSVVEPASTTMRFSHMLPGWLWRVRSPRSVLAPRALPQPADAHAADEHVVTNLVQLSTDVLAHILVHVPLFRYR